MDKPYCVLMLSLSIFCAFFTSTSAAAKSLQSCPTLCEPMTLVMAAHQAPPSLGLSRQEPWSGLPFPSPMHESKKWKWSRSVASDSSRPHGLQRTRLLHPWDFPGKSTGVGCHCLLRHICYIYFYKQYQWEPCSSSSLVIDSVILWLWDCYLILLCLSCLSHTEFIPTKAGNEVKPGKSSCHENRNESSLSTHSTIEGDQKMSTNTENNDLRWLHGEF